ncbi:esterase/lipase family protein [Vibrio methylphosphonaticus]|uniref:esterase/lipase family protein n=1 Tax=Vibrio methylphosphonaticus TaxID=2946866 RepID=UPI00202A5574|nr:hydrolase [Vibrio methylphosphonaticus]MCL9773997.1 hydrolase [Vibrio methylphosphonaticus]
MEKWCCWATCTAIAVGTISSVQAEMVDLSQLFPDKTVRSCESSNKPLQLNQNEPLVLIVHGCFASEGQFRALSEVYAELGQQTACFEYDDRDRLDDVSGDLIDAINTLSPALGEQQLTVLGHSQGGLISRRAVTRHRTDGKGITHQPLEIATISTPFKGIEAASHCGINWLRVASLGVVDAICYAVTGAKYLDIPPQADFIETPGELISQLERHLIIKTDELNTCRTQNADGQCIQDDYVFSLVEQTKYKVDSSEQSQPITVHAGHAEIVGNETVTPWKLIEVLQRYGLMAKPTPSEVETFTTSVNQIYQRFI